MLFISSINNLSSFLPSLLLWIIFFTSLLEGASPSKMKKPDFTKGDSIPKNAIHDWTLGATGARGWIYSRKLETSEARQIYITKIMQGSPADKILRVGDIILGIDGKKFSYDPRVEFGKALTAAEKEENKGLLNLDLWRNGRAQSVQVILPILGSYSDTAPFNCKKSLTIFRLGCTSLAERMREPSYNGQNAITRSLNALALLASGEQKYAALLRREAQWASQFSTNSMVSWYYGYVLTFLAEYSIQTNDDSVRSGLQRLTEEVVNGQSAIGSWGHGFAGANGRLGGYGMMNSPGIPLTSALVLARKAGIKSTKLDLAIKRSSDLLRFYSGKGCIPYGDHKPWIETHDDNGKNGMAAVLFSYLGEKDPSAYFSKMSLACHGNERDTGHTGNFWNITWAMPGVVRAGPFATGAWMRQFGSWYFDLARGFDANFRHQGPPHMSQDSYTNWDATGAILLAYALPLKKIYLTGKGGSPNPPLGKDQAEQILADGIGWSNNNRYSYYDAFSVEQLIQRLTSWSPVVRERAAMALGRKKEVSSALKDLSSMLSSDRLEERYGACQAIVFLRQRAVSLIPQLQQNLKHSDLWVRVSAAKALAAIGKPALAAAPALLKLLIRENLEEDPRAMEQRYLSFALFNSRGGMLNQSLEMVDRSSLLDAVRAGLTNQDGRSRGAYSSVFEKLSFEQLEPLLPSIYEAIAKPAPSGIMFADEIRTSGLKLFADNLVEEGIELAADYVQNMTKWKSEKRVPEVLKMLLQYGGHAQKAIPKLEKVALYFDTEPDFPRSLARGKATAVRETIKKLQNARDFPKLHKISN